jgi:large subunit ribosomal protein L29
MKTHEIRDLTTDVIQSKMNDAREEYMKMRFQQATGEITDHTRLRFTRRMIARYMTVLNERMRAGQTEGEK